MFLSVSQGLVGYFFFFSPRRTTIEGVRVQLSSILIHVYILRCGCLFLSPGLRGGTRTLLVIRIRVL